MLYEMEMSWQAIEEMHISIKCQLMPEAKSFFHTVNGAIQEVRDVMIVSLIASMLKTEYSSKQSLWP